jgi:UDP-GlcNAc3NAcA epimerase
MKIVTILGARPQFIKAGSVSRLISSNVQIREVIVHTGQHYDNNMSDIFFKEMNIPQPDYYLGIGNLSHGAMTGQMIEKIEVVLNKENPDWVLVYGDTNSTLAGAIAASKMHIKIAHVEAGLRSFNMLMPEEINRILTDRVSTLLFCPTDTAVKNLKNEGFKNSKNCKIIKNGDVMLDGALYYKKIAKKPEFIGPGYKNYILCTIHRAENTDNYKNLANIISALNKISQTHQIVLPMHPRTRKIVKSQNIVISDQIFLIDPVGYLEMIYLLDNCQFVMTDSGGLQKEAFFFKKPCITLREETEWIELVDNGFNILGGADYNRILKAVNNVNELKNKNYSIDIYGNGNASELIVTELLRNV